MWKILRYYFTLLLLQVVFSGLAFLLSEYPWPALAVSLIFLALAWKAGRSFGEELDTLGRRGAVSISAATALVWQLPGMQGTVRFLTDTVGWTQYDGVTDLQDFAMQTWHTVLLPLLAVIPPGLVDNYYARYYIALVATSPLLIMLVALAAGASRRRPGRY